jgi:glycosyltransferase involved in cell wall biosynthesis
LPEENKDPLNKELTFSIITPSFNQGSFLEETILSVSGQNYKNVEHIIIDGASTDQSVSIIRKYEKQLAFWVSEPDKGQSHAINKGFNHAKGDVVMWLNSDDVLLPDCLNKMNNFFTANPDSEMVHGRTVFFGTGQKDFLMGGGLTNMDARYLAYIPFPQPSSFFRRSLLDKIGMLNEQLHYGMDHEFLARAFLSGSRISETSDILSKYRLHPASKTNDTLQFPHEWARVFSKVLRTAGANNELIEIMKSAGLYDNQSDTFILNRTIDPVLIKMALLYHLLIQAHYHYNAIDLQKTIMFLETIKQIDKSFYSSNNLPLLNAKSRYLPGSAIRLLRNLTRN